MNSFDIGELVWICMRSEIIMLGLLIEIEDRSSERERDLCTVLMGSVYYQALMNNVFNYDSYDAACRKREKIKISNSTSI
jgi:hypothetical protein